MRRKQFQIEKLEAQHLAQDLAVPYHGSMFACCYCFALPLVFARALDRAQDVNEEYFTRAE
eukprot:4174908-Amphidinium_carterae.1